MSSVFLYDNVYYTMQRNVVKISLPLVSNPEKTHTPMDFASVS